MAQDHPGRRQAPDSSSDTPNHVSSPEDGIEAVPTGGGTAEVHQPLPEAQRQHENDYIHTGAQVAPRNERSFIFCCLPNRYLLGGLLTLYWVWKVTAFVTEYNESVVVFSFGMLAITCTLLGYVSEEWVLLFIFLVQNIMDIMLCSLNLVLVVSERSSASKNIADVVKTHWPQKMREVGNAKWMGFETFCSLEIVKLSIATLACCSVCQEIVRLRVKEDFIMRQRQIILRRMRQDEDLAMQLARVRSNGPSGDLGTLRSIFRYAPTPPPAYQSLLSYRTPLGTPPPTYSSLTANMQASAAPPAPGQQRTALSPVFEAEEPREVTDPISETRRGSRLRRQVPVSLDGLALDNDNNEDDDEKDDDSPANIGHL